MEAGQGRRAGRASSTPCCARSPRACASSPCCCTPTCPRRPSGCWPRSGQDGELRDRGGALRRGRRGRAPVTTLDPPLFPKQRVIDSHTHLDRGPAPEAELVAAARAAGVTAHPHDRDRLGVLPRRARRRRARTRRCTPPSAATRTTTTGYDDAVTDELRELAQHPTRAARSARPASTTTATTRRAPTRSARSPPRSSSRARPASRSSSTRAPPRTTRSPRSTARPTGSR